VTNRETDHATCVATGRIFTLCIAMRPKNYSERQNWRHQFRGQHECNKARCKRVVVAVGNCTREMCVRARRCQGLSTESARSPPQRLYKPVRLSIGRRAGPAGVCDGLFCMVSPVVFSHLFHSHSDSSESRVDVFLCGGFPSFRVRLGQHQKQSRRNTT